MDIESLLVLIANLHRQIIELQNKNASLEKEISSEVDNN